MENKNVKTKSKTYVENGKTLLVKATYSEEYITDWKGDVIPNRKLDLLLTVSYEGQEKIIEDKFYLGSDEIIGWESFARSDSDGKLYFGSFGTPILYIRNKSLTEQIDSFLKEFVTESTSAETITLIEEIKKKKAADAAEAAKMEVFLTIEDASGYNATLQKARYLTNSEKEGYADWCKDIMMTSSVEDNIDIPEITWRDMPKRQSDGQFNGCNNRVWIITQEEWDSYISINAQRAKEKAKKKKQEEIEYLERAIRQAESQKDLPTKEEARRRMKVYNDIHNEGGEGFVPHVYSKEEHQNLRERLEIVKEEMQRLEEAV